MRFVSLFVFSLVVLSTLCASAAHADCRACGRKPRVVVEATPGTRVVIRGGLFSLFRPRVVVEYPAK